MPCSAILRKLARKIRISTKYNFYVDNFLDFFWEQVFFQSRAMAPRPNLEKRMAHAHKTQEGYFYTKRREGFKKGIKSPVNTCFFVYCGRRAKKSPGRNRGRLPKLTAYEKIDF
jgi:hypothetical protein